jgi:hypothetical protein
MSSAQKEKAKGKFSLSFGTTIQILVHLHRMARQLLLLNL